MNFGHPNRASKLYAVRKSSRRATGPLGRVGITKRARVKKFFSTRAKNRALIFRTRSREKSFARAKKIKREKILRMRFSSHTL
jgi:hypothetical protein